MNLCYVLQHITTSETLSNELLKPKKACIQWERELHVGIQSASMTKTMKNFLSELLLDSNSAMEFLCDAEKLQATIFTKGQYFQFVTFQLSCLCFTIVSTSDLCILETLEALLWKWNALRSYDTTKSDPWSFKSVIHISLSLQIWA